MKKYVAIIISVTIIVALILAWQKFKGVTPAVLPPAEIPVNENELGLSLPPGFSIEVYATGLPGARQMALDDFGNIWVSQPSEGSVSFIEVSDGAVYPVFTELDNPHGIAIRNNTIYIAEETQIRRFALYSDDPGQVIAQLPKGGRHSTRTLEVGPDERLYVSIGSTCDVCFESDERHASIYSMNLDGGDMRKVASGLRNAVFFDWSYVDGKMWATEMGRDNLGDDLPPDEINIIETGKDYGWPVCYGKNILDTNFNSGATSCTGKTHSHIDLPAHSAPLGLAFIPEEGWPEDYWYDLIVAFHGSWNRSEPTGYKLVRIKLDAQGNYEGTDSTGSPQVEDFVTGWLDNSGTNTFGRPVDLMIFPGGILFISDDKAGVIYKISRNIE